MWSAASQQGAIGWGTPPRCLERWPCRRMRYTSRDGQCGLPQLRESPARCRVARPGSEGAAGVVCGSLAGAVLSTFVVPDAGPWPRVSPSWAEKFSHPWFTLAIMQRSALRSRIGPLEMGKRPARPAPRWDADGRIEYSRQGLRASPRQRPARLLRRHDWLRSSSRGQRRRSAWWGVAAGTADRRRFKGHRHER